MRAVVVLLPTLVGLLNLAAARRVDVVNSDDAAHFLIIRDWLRDPPSVTYIGSNNYLWRVPILGLFDAGMVDPTRTVDWSSVFFAALAYPLIGWAVWAVVRSIDRPAGRLVQVMVVATAVWLASLPGLAGAIVRPNVRGAELGATLAFVVGAELWTRRTGRVRVLSAILWVLAATLFLFSDPYFVFVAALPVAVVFLIVGGLHRNRRQLGAGAALVVAVILSKVAEVAGPLVGFKLPPAPIQRLPLNRLDEAVASVIASSKVVLSMSGRPDANMQFTPTAATTAMAWGNRAMVGLAAAGLCIVAVCWLRRWNRSPALYPLVLTLVAAPTAAYTLSANSVLVWSHRYLNMTVVTLPVVLALGVVLLPRRLVSVAAAVVTAVAVVAVGCNAFRIADLATCDVRQPACSRSADSRTRQQQLVQAARQVGATKVFGPYWDVGTVRFLTDGQIDAVAVTCQADQRLAVFRWLTTDEAIHQPASRSHLLVVGGSFAGCPPAKVFEQLGPPGGLERSDGLAWYWWPGDVAARLPTVDS